MPTYFTYCLDNKCKDNFKCTRYDPSKLQNMKKKGEAFLTYLAPPIRNSESICEVFIVRTEYADTSNNEIKETT